MARYRRTPRMVRMNWLARKRLTAGLRGLGHKPEWFTDQRGRQFAACRDCVWAWGAPASMAAAANFIRTTDSCRRRGRR